MLSLAVAGGSTVSGKGCWDLVEVNCAAIEVQNPEWNSVQAEPQDLKGEKEINWEESSLAKFGKFLGFPTEGGNLFPSYQKGGRFNQVESRARRRAL